MHLTLSYSYVILGLEVFMYFPELIIEPTDTVLRLKVTGPYTSRLRMKEYLTLTNSSVTWQIREAKKKLIEYRSKGIPDDSKWSQFQIQKLNELIPSETEELYFDGGDHLIIPAGFYYLAPNSSPFMVNTEVKPYYLDHLRDYQKQALSKILEYKRGVLHIATGGGKSVVLTSLAISLVKAGKRVMVVVPSDYLVGQLYKTMAEHHDSVTAAGGGRNQKLGSDILVVTAQSAKKYASSYQAILSDEGHHNPAQTWQDLMTANPDIEYVYSCSATPERSDGLDLLINALSGNIKYTLTVRDAIEGGWLCKPLIYQIKVSNDERFSGNALKAYKALVQTPQIFGLIRNKIVAAMAKGHKPIVIFKTVIACNAFKKFAKELNFQVAHGEYKKPLYDFAKGEADLLVACDKLISEGVDLPHASFLIIATQHTSAITSYQAVGRILRKAPGKEQAIVIDIAVQDFKQYLNASKKRLAIYKEICDDVFTIKL